MRYSALVTLILIVGFLSGCTNRSRIMDCERFDSGELKSVAEVSKHDNHRHYAFKTEYFKNGRLKSEQWSKDSGLFVHLEFHKNGMLKSEERYSHNQIRYAAYYSSDGQLEKNQGRKIDPEIQCYTAR